jgi:hypothetical protein
MKIYLDGFFYQLNRHPETTIFFKHIDEIIFGVILSLIGFTLFNIGIELGLGTLGKQVGKVLPAAYSSIQIEKTKTN